MANTAARHNGDGISLVCSPSLICGDALIPGLDPEFMLLLNFTTSTNQYRTPVTVCACDAPYLPSRYPHDHLHVLDGVPLEGNC